MLMNDFLVFTADEMNQHLTTPIDYNCFFRIDEVRECYCKGNSLKIFTESTTYDFDFFTEVEAKKWYSFIINKVITEEV
jgi:hypothetical protein